MNKLFLPNYNIYWTLIGGQSHNWQFDGEFYYGSLTEKIVKIKYKDNNLFWQTYPNNDDEEFILNYFNTKVDYEKILTVINKDEHIKSALEKYPNLRILRQDFEETLISYIFASNKNLGGIRKSISKLREFYGTEFQLDGKTFYSFPSAEKLFDAKEEKLRETGMGFRAKYLISALESIQNGLSTKIIGMNENDARNKLIKIFGVGEKIADCVLIYGLGFDNVTPLDVWGKRIVVDLYKQNEKEKYEAHRRWISNYFEGYAGWAGQFLFEYIRNL